MLRLTPSSSASEVVQAALRNNETTRSLIESYSREDLLPKKPYIIAEAGVNHEGDIDIARKLIEQAKLGGADAIKFQTYKADKIASKTLHLIGI